MKWLRGYAVVKTTPPRRNLLVREWSGYAATRLRSCLRSRVATLFKISFGVEGYSAVKPNGSTKSYNAHAQLLVCSLNLLFSGVPVAVAVVVFLNSLIHHENAALFLRLDLPSTLIHHENAALFLRLGLPSTLIHHENTALFLRLGLPSTLIRHEDGAFPKQMTDDDNCVSNFSGVIWTENIWRIFRVKTP